MMVFTILRSPNIQKLLALNKIFFLFERKGKIDVPNMIFSKRKYPNMNKNRKYNFKILSFNLLIIIIIIIIM